MLASRSRELSAGKGLTLQEFKDQLAALDKEMRSLPATAQVSRVQKSVGSVVRPVDARCLLQQQGMFCCTRLLVSQRCAGTASCGCIPSSVSPRRHRCQQSSCHAFEAGASQLQWV